MLAIPALIVALICSAWMLSREIKRRSFLSGKLWIATVFVFVLSTRSVSQWVLGTGSAISSNPLDEAFYGRALGASFLIATSRGVKWGRFFAGNLPMLLVYAFFLLSVFWSAEPFSS